MDNRLPQRKHPIHLPPTRAVNRPVIIWLTVCVRGRRPLLANDRAHALLRSAWIEANLWHVGRYVIMPDHVPLFCSPADDVTSLKKWMYYWRRCATRHWPVAADKPIWQRDYWDRELRKEEKYFDTWTYVAQNPVRAGLVDDAESWPYQGELNCLDW